MNTKEVTQLSTGYQSIRAYIPSVSTLIMAFMLHYRSTHTRTHTHTHTHTHTQTHTHTRHALTRKEGEWLCVCVLVRKRVVGLCVVFDGVCWQACAQHATDS